MLAPQEVAAMYQQAAEVGDRCLEEGEERQSRVVEGVLMNLVEEVEVMVAFR